MRLFIYHPDRMRKIIHHCQRKYRSPNFRTRDTRLVYRWWLISLMALAAAPIRRGRIVRAQSDGIDLRKDLEPIVYACISPRTLQ